MDATKLTAERIVKLLRKQRELYEQLQHLSRRQRSLISGDQPEQLLSILRDRQSLVNALAQINHQLSPLRASWQSAFDKLPEPERSEVAALLEDVNRILAAIIRTDQEDGALLSARKQSVGQVIDRAQDGRAANAAYGRSAPQRPSGGAADLQG